MASIDYDWAEQPRPQPAPQAVRGVNVRLVRALVMACGLAGLAGAIHALWPKGPVPTPTAPETLPPFWRAVDRPQPVFTVRGVPHRIESRSHTGKAGEEDAIVVGTFGTGGASGFHARLILERPGPEPRPHGSFYVDAVRRAGESGIALMRMAQPVPVDTAFGPLEVAESVLSGSQGARACLVMRSRSGDDALRVAGWLCGAEPPAREIPALQCLAAAVALAAPREQPDLARLMAATARQVTRSC